MPEQSGFKDGGEVRVLTSAPSVVKAIKDGDQHKLLVLGAPFGSPSDKDKDGEYFSRNTDFMVDPGDRRPVIYMHGVDPDGKAMQKPERLGLATVKNVNSSGLWFEATVDYTKELGKRLWDRAQKGRVRASTGAIAHLFRKAGDGEILTWAIGELSLLDVGAKRRPANDKALALALKSVYSDAELEYPKAFVEADEAGAGAEKRHSVDTETERGMRKADAPVAAPEEAPQPPPPSSGLNFVVVDQEGMFVVYLADESGAPSGNPVGAHLTQEEADAEVAALMAAPKPEEAPPEEAEKPPVPPAKATKEIAMDDTVKAVLEALKAEKDAEKAQAEAEAKIRADERAKVEGELKSKAPAWKGGFATLNIAGKDSKNEATDAFLYWLRTGDAVAAKGQLKAAMQEDNSSEGGFLVPVDFYDQIVAKRNELSIVRKAGARVTQTSRDSIQIPTEGTATTTFVATAEEANYNQNEPVLDPITVQVFKWTKLILVSNELLSDQAANLEQFIAIDLAQKMAMTENRYAMRGTGSSQHLGIFTTDAAYAPTEHSLTSDGLTGALTYANFVAGAYKLNAEYRENASWFMHNQSEGELRGLVAATFPQFPTMGMPAMGEGYKLTGLLDRPLYNQRNIEVASDVADSDDVTTYLAAFGDMSYYALVERSGLEVSRNPYLYQLSDQTGIFAKFRQGGAPLQGEAFVLFKGVVNT